jgi:hypothetical protein
VYLIDTNIWLERLLNQQQSDIAGEFLAAIPSENLAMSDFTFHSIALALTRRQLAEPLQAFIQDVFLEGNTKLLSLSPIDMRSILAAMKDENLDYDDAYQYVVAKRYDLVLISFDTDFDGTTEGRKTPQEVLAEER